MKASIPLLFLALGLSEIAAGSDWHHAETRRHPAAEAIQGVAVDEDHFYAITNRAIGKYRKDTGARIAFWEDAADGRLRHLNAGVVFGGKLYCAHSNYPKRPEESSIEIWDTATLRHLESHPFDKPPGSLTWVDQRDGKWFACFAHYRASSDPALSRVVSFDAGWEPLATWTFPAEVIARFVDHSSSGGSFGPGGHLFVSGHDATELYILDLPAGGGVMTWLGTVAISAAGQAFAWDRTPGAEGVLYSIQRKTREVIVSRVASGGFTPLFDGRTFTGWEHGGNWVIEDGAFYRKAGGGPLTYTVGPVPDDFELRFEWKVSKGCNSGVYYRPAQYEYQVLDDANSPYGENPRQAAASLFFCMAPSKNATRPHGEWNEGRVVCKGTVIEHWLNGERVISFDYADPKWAKEVELLRIRGADLAARGGRLWLQDHGADVWFRHLRMREIPDDEVIVADPHFKPLPIPPAALEKENERVRKMVEQAKAKPKKP
jgi:hypothetical protein